MLDSMQERIRDFVSQKGKFAVTVLGILLVLGIGAVVLSVANAARKTASTVPASIQPRGDITPAESFFAPSANDGTDDYYFYRTTSTSWTKEESESWFTTPDKNTVESLERANDALIDTITGAAP
ncbi:MAG: hypothetical protein J1D88_08055 [Treponema sp.]|nr:hypothetical protein [Treponema sp.]